MGQTTELDARELICELHAKDGALALSKLPGLWERRLDRQWTFWVNGHGEVLQGGPDADLPVNPGCVYVEFNGWPAGIFSLITGEGEIAAGELANYQTFCEALQQAVNRGSECSGRKG